MSRLLLVLNILICTLPLGWGALYKPTKGDVWPAPQNVVRRAGYFVYKPEVIQFEITLQSCDIITRAVQRYKSYLDHLYSLTRGGRRYSSHNRSIKVLQLTLNKKCESYPHRDMDEAYSLLVDEMSELTSNSVWGILRGLESFVQLFYINDQYTEVGVNATRIIDFPQYSHRGLLLDTSRHFLSVEKILQTLDGMEANKMNVFHWHVVDDQSFPFVSQVYPELSKMGAYHDTLVYTPENVARIIDYARDRAIRVIPEFDVPGHTRSWGMAYPQLLTKCYDGLKVVGLGPMNPINNDTYKFLQQLFMELRHRFPDEQLHLGGDEVDMSCWLSNPQLLKYMKDHDISDVRKFQSIFMNHAVALIKDKFDPIVWQEVFEDKVPLPKNTIVQVWKYDSVIQPILEAGYKVVYSAAWYLDHLSSGGDWENFYKVDPRQLVSSVKLRRNVVGGEACMWGEVVDDTNVISRVWPRASAIAEKLWSPSIEYKWGFLVDSNMTIVRQRIEEQTCRMLRRGISAEPPNGPGFCIV